VRPESDEARTERQRLWLWEAFTQGEDPHAAGALVSGPADVAEVIDGWQPDILPENHKPR
jgi:hypothetical protein